MINAISLTGPTASGKTALSLLVSEALSCEIISCDSMQIYRGMDIGTAKATDLERRAVPHHLIDFLSPTEAYSAERYRADAITAARDIAGRGKIPFFVGGTGLYLDTVSRGQDHEAPAADPEIRARLTREAEELGGGALYERLFAVDPEAARLTHPNNLRRVIRALEIYEGTGITKTELDRRAREADGEISLAKITLDFKDRELLYARVDARVDIMMRDGLLAEVEGLLSRGELISDTTAAQAIGYKEIIAHLNGEISLSEAVDLIKLSSRRYAKRQLTWFRRDGGYRLYVDDGQGSMRSPEELAREAVAYYAAERQ